jgi:hypothetical protein
MAVYRTIERWDRSGDIRRSEFLLGALYAAAILAVGPFAAGMLHSSPLGRYIPGIGGIPYRHLFLGAFVTFALLWTEPEIEQFKPVRGFFKLLLLAAVVQLGAIVWSHGPPFIPPIGRGTAEELRAAIALSGWTVAVGLAHLVYRLAWKPWLATTFMFVLVGTLSIGALIQGGLVWGTIVLVASLGLLPLGLALARTSCWDIAETGWRPLYGVGVWQPPLVGYIRTRAWRRNRGQETAVPLD